MERHNPKSSLFWAQFCLDFYHHFCILMFLMGFKSMPYIHLRSWVSSTRNLLRLLALWFYHLLLNNVLSFSRLLLFARWELQWFLYVHLFSAFEKCHITSTVQNNRKITINKSEQHPRFTFPRKERKKPLVSVCFLCTFDTCLHRYENTSYYVWSAPALSYRKKC